jgi:hypothetical protein
MQILITLFTAALFFALTPHILVTIPAHSNKYIVALTHALLFALIYHLAQKTFNGINIIMEIVKKIKQDIQSNGYTSNGRVLSYKLPNIVL